MRRRLCTSLALAALACAAGAPAASADGLPVAVDQAFGEGLVSPDGSHRYVSIGVSDRTVILQNVVEDGEVHDYTTVRGQYTIPAIALDGTASGMSADGRTLVLIAPRETFPRRSTSFLIYDVSKRGVLGRRSSLTLEGDFSFDALSPDGENLYLIEYLDPRDPGAYQVRAFDLRTRELDPDPILDTEEEPGDMRGFPQTRVTSPDGRWEYTLYDGGGGHPFIHALDVVEAKTVCIDLEMRPRDTQGATLELRDDASQIAVIDRKGELRETADAPDGAAPEETEAAADEPGGVNLEAAGIVAGGLVLAVLAAATMRRRTRN